MSLHILPNRVGGAAENMAVDFLLLQRYPDARVPRFRHYEWRRPAFTFGYAQKISFVREQLSLIAGESAGELELCRRPTGGGMVDHRDDWTYALVIPRGHALEELRATGSYRVVHEALVEALRAQGVAARTKPTGAEPPAEEASSRVSTAAKPLAAAAAGICFERAELYDVVNEQSGRKLAGAAQKRNKHGLLFQGSVWRPALGGATVDWERLQENFASRLASALGAEPGAVPWPEFNEDELMGLTEQYASPEWLSFR